MNKKLISFFVIVLFALTGCQIKQSQKKNFDYAIPVITTTVMKTSIGDEISLSGNVEGSKTVRLGFMVAGKIDFIAVNEGEKVSKGQLISSLDPVSYGIAKEIAGIQVDQVQDEYNRLKLMHDKNSLSESDFKKISFGLQQAKAQLKLHAKNLSDTKLYSPIDGVLLKKLAEVGEITGVGIPVLVVSDIKKVKVNGYIPENELHNIRIGQLAEVLISSLNRTYEGKIIEVGSVADAASRAFSLKLEVENPELLIKPGMIAEARIMSDRKSDVLAIPADAIMHDFNDQSFVYVADTLKGKAFKRIITFGRIIRDKIEIIGLSEKELIVTGGQQKLSEGSDIIISK